MSRSTAGRERRSSHDQDEERVADNTRMVSERLETHASFAAAVRRGLDRYDDAKGLDAEFTRGNIGAHLASRLLSPARLYRVIETHALMPPELRFLNNGVELHPKQFLARTAQGSPARMPDPERVSRLLDEGATVVVDALQRMDLVLELACRSLQWWLGERVEVNAYLTTGQTFGFSRHADDHDVLVVQIDGEKDWEIGGFSSRHRQRQSTSGARPGPHELVWEGRLRSGDVIYLPNGQLHRARHEGSGYSLHLTFGFSRRNGADWAHWIADKLSESAVSGAESQRLEEGATGQEGTLISALSSLAVAHPPSSYLNGGSDTDVARGHIYSSSVSPRPECIVCMTEFPARLEMVGDQELEVLADGRRALVGSTALPAVERFVSGHPVTMTEAEQLVGEEAREVAEVLLRERICSEATPEVLEAFAVGRGSLP